MISTGSIWYRFRWLWLSLLLATLGLAAGLGIGHFRLATDRARRVEFSLQAAHSNLLTARAMEWRAIARRDPGSVAVTRAVEAGIANLRPLAAGDSQLAQRSRSVLRDIAAYKSAAISLDERRAGPLFASVDGLLTRAIRASESQRAAAENRAVLAARVIVVSAALVMLVALGLYARARRRSLVSELAQDALERQVAVRGFEADHDELTNLLNRRGFFARLRQGVEGGDRSQLAVLLLDLDGFKEINDTLGHGAGDTLLTQIGPRLLGALREGDTLARLGGDEFAIVIAGAKAAERSAEVGQRIRAAMVAPFEVAGLALQVRASVGIALFPEHGPSAEELVRRADIAMYEAKRNRAGVAVYAAADDPLARHGLELASELENALRDGELVVYYQPKAELSTGAVTGVEALVRWQHPERGLIGPDAFVPVAERNGLIRQLTLDVVRRGLAQQAQWRAEGIDLSLAINLSIANLLDGDLPNEIAALLRRHGGRPGRLGFEITESYLMTDPTLIHGNLQQLCETGIRLALDDFGTGYSSFTHLRQLPIDEVKIDRSFIKDLEHDDDAAVIVRSTIELAHNLNLCVVAEGVETESVWNRLRQLGCDEAQGYYLTPPIPANSLTGWLLNRDVRKPVPSAR